MQTIKHRTDTNNIMNPDQQIKLNTCYKLVHVTNLVATKCK